VVGRGRTLRYLGRLQQQMNSGNAQAEARFHQMLSVVKATEVQLLDPDFLKEVQSFVVFACGWLKEQLAEEEEQAMQFCRSCPEHLVDDILSIMIFISRMSPGTLGSCPLDGFLEFCVLVLDRPALVRSPHLRAKFGDILYLVFLPPEDRLDSRPEAMQSPLLYGLLLASRSAQQSLAPSLLRLYGDVEHTGFYDKLEHRYHIAAVLKYLWKSPEHR
jgi:ubiquitin conjugation factor E4 B